MNETDESDVFTKKWDEYLKSAAFYHESLKQIAHRFFVAGRESVIMEKLQMPTLLYTGALTNVLLDHQVKAKDISIAVDEQNDLVTVTVKNRKGIKDVAASRDKIVNDPNAFICQLIDLAYWYHGGRIPQGESFAEWLSRNVSKLFGVHQ